MQKTFEGKVVLITGGSRGLGVALAEAFAGYGANIAISYAASADKAEALVEKLTARGVRAIAIHSDRYDLTRAKPMIDAVIAEFGKIDILINNADIATQGQLVDEHEHDEEKYNRQWQLNVLGSIANTRAAASRLSDGGRIIFIASLVGGYVPFKGVADYAAPQSALAGYARGIARDLGARNITVNVVQPGAMPTEMHQEVAGELASMDTFLGTHPIRRFASLEEVAELTCFLAGPDAAYITGETINVAGGLSI